MFDQPHGKKIATKSLFFSSLNWFLIHDDSKKKFQTNENESKREEREALVHTKIYGMTKYV